MSVTIKAGTAEAAALQVSCLHLSTLVDLTDQCLVTQSEIQNELMSRGKAEHGGE